MLIRVGILVRSKSVAHTMLLEGFDEGLYHAVNIIELEAIDANIQYIYLPKDHPDITKRKPVEHLVIANESMPVQSIHDLIEDLV